MPFNFNTDVPVFNRTYQQLENGLGIVSIGDIQASVVHDKFWIKFAQGWEPETERIYRKLVKPGSVVLDIGAWIGSTILFALACGAEKVVALEPNPDSYAVILRFLELNPEYASKIQLTNRALSYQDEIISMGLAEGENDTSTSGLAGDDFEVQATTLETIVNDYNLGEIDLIKIDIEGAEVLLSETLEKLSKKPSQIIHLSVHVTFFPEDIDKSAFVKSLENFSIYDDRGSELSQTEFESRIMTSESHPQWGTKHGNFFEVLLIADR